MRIKKAEMISLNQIKIQDEFWDKYRKLVHEVILKYQWDVMNDAIEGAEKSHCIENFKIASGKAKGEFYGEVFQDSDVAKWLEAVAYSLMEFPDEELEKQADKLINLIEAAQQPDGYFNTYYILKEPDRRFENLREGHELYTLGHMIEAAVAYYKATKKEKFLNIVCKMTDLIDDTFGSEQGKRRGMPGHQEIELALVKLYEVTGEERYLKLAKYFIDVRGLGKDNYFLQEMKRDGQRNIFPELVDYRPEYAQAHLPVRKQRTAEGHAVRACYMYCAMADLAEKYQDQELLKVCETLMDNIITKRMYVTGGIGSSGILERFTVDYDLPNGYNYSETCASIGLALFARRMLLITKDGKYADIMERVLYNAVLAGVSMEGTEFFYVNPLEIWPKSCIERTSKEHIKSKRQKWFGVACCPANISRTLASIGEYIYGYEKNTIYINLYIQNTATILLERGEVQIEMRAKYPWEKCVEIEITGMKKEDSNCMLAVRIPEYADDFQILWNGIHANFQMNRGYAYIKIKQNGCCTVLFEFSPRFLHANPKVREDAGKVCIANGPLVYAAEEIDNGENLSALYIDTAQAIAYEKNDEFVKNAVFLTAQGKRIKEDDWRETELYKECRITLQDTKIKFIPYAYWNNRGEGEMSVWFKELVK